MDIITSLTWTIYHFIVGQIIILNSLLKSSFPLTMQVVNRIKRGVVVVVRIIIAVTRIFSIRSPK